MNERKTGVARLMQIAMTKRILVILSIIFSILASIASFIPYICIYKIILEIFSIYPDTLMNDAIIMYAWYAMLGAIANVILYLIALIFSHLAAFSTLYQLKVNFISHLSDLPLGFHIHIGSGRIRKMIDQDIEQIEGFIAHQLPDLSAAFFSPIVMLIIVFKVDWRFGIATLVGVLVAFFIQIKLFSNQSSKDMMKAYQKSLAQMNNASVEYVRGISIVKAFNQTIYSFKRLYKTFQEYVDLVIPYTLNWQNGFSAYSSLLNNLYLFIIPVGIIIGMNTDDYALFASTFIFYLIFVPSIAEILMKLMYVTSDMRKIVSGVEAMDEILDMKPLPYTNNVNNIDSFDIEFKNVDYSYEGQVKALNNISFNARQGKIIAIVGASGSGKSTIANLIPRFFDVDGGSISIGNHNIKDIENDYLMDIVTFVFQDVFLFKQSIIENIRIAKPDASELEVINACKAAQCHEFILQLPNGYHTIIGKDNVHLSGGEKQRIAIARAIVKDAPIVILDEATAFSDPQNEHLIQKAFEELLKDKTVIMIAHRLSTIKNADNIIVMDNANLIEEGKHDYLMSIDGKYALMYNTYLKASTWKLTNRKELDYA